MIVNADLGIGFVVIFAVDIDLGSRHGKRFLLCMNALLEAIISAEHSLLLHADSGECRHQILVRNLEDGFNMAVRRGLPFSFELNHP